MTPEEEKAIVEKMLIAFLTEKSAQCGEPFYMDMWEEFKRDKPEEYHEEFVQMQCAFDVVKDEIEKRQWRPITNSPAFFGNYLVWLEPIGGDGEPSWSVRKAFYNGKWDIDGLDDTPEDVQKRITHWMPLPDKPQYGSQQHDR